MGFEHSPVTSTSLWLSHHVGNRFWFEAFFKQHRRSISELLLSAMNVRVLYLDDSGKPEAGHASGAAIIAGLAIDAERYATFSRRILGAKGAHFANRGAPQEWEIKSSNFVRPNE